MEEESFPVSSSSNGTFLLVALSIFAIFLGGLALFFSFQQRSDLKLLESQLASSSSDNLSGKIEDLENQLALFQSIAQEQKKQLQQHHSALKILAKKPIPKANNPQPNSPKKPSSNPIASASSNSSKTHQIKGGDTLGKLANQYNTTLEAILEANPNVDPRRLQIGQTIQLR